MPETRIIKRYANRKLYDTEHNPVRHARPDQRVIRRRDWKIADNKTKET